MAEGRRTKRRTEAGAEDGLVHGAQPVPSSHQEDSSSDEEPDEAMQKMIKAFEKVAKKNDKKWDARVKTVVTEVKDIFTAKMEENSCAMDARWKKELGDLRDELLGGLDAVNQKVATLSTAGSVAATSRTVGSTRVAANTDDEKNFTAEHIKIKWHDEYPVPDQYQLPGGSDSEVSRWLEQLYSTATGADLIDKELTAEANNRDKCSMIVLMLRGKLDVESARVFTNKAWNLKRSIESKAALRVRGMELKIKIQAHPERARLLAATGRALGILHRTAELAKQDMKPKWIPSRVFYTGLLLDGTRPTRPLQLVSWHPEEGYGVQDRNLAMVTNRVTAKDLLDELSADF